ncbi:M20 metallopeptidase family protein [Brevibacterium otitidis]|uniref:M20 family metallopeptidase n=1 Tax=Brevibacterium otitidis TaxID=53364 RepID=A0ABV5X085_9MICO|nr:M20 family metallopeptidase [Brevibacterium otitidis]
MSLISHSAAVEILPDLQRLRRDLHRHPELGLDLPRTQARVAEELAGLDVEVTRGQSLSSLTVVLRGGKRDPENPVAVLLRGDMDGLPVTEATGFDFASTNGAMHACGHDLHTTGLLGALRLLHEVRAELAGDVIFMFQPGEEGYDGAGHMLREGVLDAAGVPVIAAYGVHVSADQELGNLYCRPGSYMSAFSLMHITVRGKGGHASRPHTTRDPIQVGAMLVGQLQEYNSRRFDAFDPIIITVGQFHAGTAPNVIPDTAELTVGIRSFSEASTAQAEAELPQFVRDLTAAHGLEAEVEYRNVLPPVINDETETRFYMQTAAEVFGPDHTHLVTVPKPGSEDFSRVLQQVPGTYGHVGAALPGVVAEEQDSNHSPRARHSDEGLGQHARFLAELAAGRLAQHAAAPEEGVARPEAATVPEAVAAVPEAGAAVPEADGTSRGGDLA